MFNRRTLLCGGLLAVIQHDCPCSLAETSAFSGAGCEMDEGSARTILEASSTTAAFMPGAETMTHSSGNKQFDFALAQSLARMSEAFQVLPAFAFFREPQGPNAHAATHKLNRSDGTVLFGFQLLKYLFSMKEHPDVATSAVCAHEFAHILQFKRNITPILARDPTVRRLELHADFMSGYFAGLSKRRKPDYPAAVVANIARLHGDNQKQSRQHHGTSEERSAAVVKGFELGYAGNAQLDDVVQSGIAFVSQV